MEFGVAGHKYAGGVAAYRSAAWSRERGRNKGTGIRTTRTGLGSPEADGQPLKALEGTWLQRTL